MAFQRFKRIDRNRISCNETESVIKFILLCLRRVFSIMCSTTVRAFDWGLLSINQTCQCYVYALHNIRIYAQNSSEIQGNL